MSISWACQFSVAEYAAMGRSAPAPRLTCRGCGKTMAFDGSYPRQVREAGVVHRIFVSRAWCSGCGVGQALLPDFVLVHRHDSTQAVGAAVLTSAGHPVPPGAVGLYEGVSARTVRSWRQRFTERAEELAKHFAAQCAARGDLTPKPEDTPVKAALQMMGATWRAVNRCRGRAGPPAWPLANVITGGGLLGTRVDLPQAVAHERNRRSRAP